MSRSGYSDDSENLELWRANVERTIAGRKGQEFLKDLADKMDAMPEKKLIKGDLVTPSGEVCTMGVVWKARALPLDNIDVDDFDRIARAVGVSSMLTQEIEYQNDEIGHFSETDEERWARMRSWVTENLK